jgi:hypothetical protein
MNPLHMSCGLAASFALGVGVGVNIGIGVGVGVRYLGSLAQPVIRRAGRCLRGFRRFVRRRSNNSYWRHDHQPRTDEQQTQRLQTTHASIVSKDLEARASEGVHRILAFAGLPVNSRVADGSPCALLVESDVEQQPETGASISLQEASDASGGRE